MSHHSPDDDNFGSQGSTDGEDGHQSQTEYDEVDAQKNFTHIKHGAGPLKPVRSNTSNDGLHYSISEFMK